MNAVGRKGQNMFINKHFAFDEDAGSAGGAAETTPEPEGGNDEPKPMTFDEMLASNPEYQKEFDRRTTKGINTAVTKERDRLNKIHNDQLDEVQKLAVMNEEEKQSYLERKKMSELDKREAAITRRELEAEAKDMLTSRELPLSLIQAVNLTSAETVKASIDGIEVSFTEAVDKRLDNKLKGGRPPKDASTEGINGEDVKIAEVRKFMRRQ